MTNTDMTQLADYLGQMIRQAAVETIRHTVGEDAATRAANNMRAIPLPGDDTEPADAEPAVPVWPTAPYMWWKSVLFQRDEDGNYVHPDGIVCPMTDGSAPDDHPWVIESRAFAREAVPVTLVPTEAWEAWSESTEWHRSDTHDALLDAVDSLAQEAAR